MKIIKDQKNKLKPNTLWSCRKCQKKKEIKIKSSKKTQILKAYCERKTTKKYKSLWKCSYHFAPWIALKGAIFHKNMNEMNRKQKKIKSEWKKHHKKIATRALNDVQRGKIVAANKNNSKNNIKSNKQSLNMMSNNYKNSRGK